jgi:asparagine synthase (glutamine-hydrolysing)
MQKIFNKIISCIKKLFYPKIIHQVTKSKLSFLSPVALLDIYNVVSRLEKREIKGVFIEAGCALGGSAIVIAKAKREQRPFYIYDAFGMIPEPSEEDGTDAHNRYDVIKSGQAKGLNENLYYGYEEDLLSKVKENFREFNIDINNDNIHFIKGLYQDSLRINDDVAFAHIDADWYESVITCLAEIEPHLVSGAVLIIDDYNDWEGCKKAVDTYFHNKLDDYHFIQRSRLHIIRK